MYAGNRALRQKQCDSYDEPEGPPLPARIALRGFPESDYFNRDESLYFGIPQELETAAASPNTAYLTGFGAAATGAVVGTAVAGPVGGVVGGLVGNIVRQNKDPQRIAQAQADLSAARNGSQAALTEIITQMMSSATDTGKAAYRSAYQTLVNEGRVGPDGRTLVTGGSPSAPAVVAITPGSGGVPGSPNQVTPGTTVQAGMLGSFDVKTLALVGLGAFVLSKVAGGSRRRARR